MIKTIVIGAGVMAPRSRIGWLRPARLLRRAATGCRGCRSTGKTISNPSR